MTYMTWISELAGQQRMIILENLDWLTQFRTNLDSILNYSNNYTEWKKRLIQGCVKFEQVLLQLGDFLLIEKHLSAICKWTIIICTMYYFIPVTSSLRKNYHLCRRKMTAVNAILPFSVWSTETPLKVYQTMPGSPNYIVQ